MWCIYNTTVNYLKPSVPVSFPITETQYLRTTTWRKRHLFGLTVTEVPVHDWLSPAQKQHGRKGWRRTDTHFMVVGKQTKIGEKGTRHRDCHFQVPLPATHLWPGPASQQHIQPWAYQWINSVMTISSPWPNLLPKALTLHMWNFGEHFSSP